MKKVVLAYSGGLDTTCCVKWLKDKGFDVVCFSANLGSEFSPDDLRKKAKKSGVSKLYVKDLRKEFIDDYIVPVLKASAIYEGKYVLSTALGRPLIAKHLVDIAHQEKAEYVSHGCTGKGNDQVRIELGVMTLDPGLKIIAPLREWDLTSRESEIAYAKKHDLPLSATKEKIYSIDKNIWGISVEGGTLENLTIKPNDNSYYFVKPLQKARDKETFLEIEFKNGVPISLNGKKVPLITMIEKLNLTGADCGVGRTDLIEDRVIGIKSREIYEAPAAWILHFAHRELEHLTLDRETLFMKYDLASKYAWLVYRGLWFTEFKASLDALIERSQGPVNGSIGLSLYKGNITVISRSSKNALYKKEMATYGEGDRFDRTLAEGFIKVLGMPYIK